MFRLPKKINIIISSRYFLLVEFLKFTSRKNQIINVSKVAKHRDPRFPRKLKKNECHSKSIRDELNWQGMSQLSSTISMAHV